MYNVHTYELYVHVHVCVCVCTHVLSEGTSFPLVVDVAACCVDFPLLVRRLLVYQFKFWKVRMCSTLVALQGVRISRDCFNRRAIIVTYRAFRILRLIALGLHTADEASVGSVGKVLEFHAVRVLNKASP